MPEVLTVKMPSGQAEFFPGNEVVLRRCDGESISLIVSNQYEFAFFHGWALDAAVAAESTRNDS